MGEQQKITVRIILVPLPVAVVEKRVYKAKADLDKRLNEGQAINYQSYKATNYQCLVLYG